jgi:hypothetical protein
MRTFLERRLFGAGDRVFTWVAMAGIAWLVVGFYGTLLAVALIFSFWYMANGFAVALFGSSLPIAFARQLLFRRSASWTAAAAVYGLATSAALLVIGPSVGGSVVTAVAALIPAILSALALWEIRRGPPFPRPDSVG